jgi:hypothetical protein
LTPSCGAAPRFLLANHDELGPPQEPLVRFEARQAPTRMAPVPGRDELLIALFGDKRPVTGPPARARAGASSVSASPITRSIP